MTTGLQAALAAFARGEPVCVFDAENREGETDLLFPPLPLTPRRCAGFDKSAVDCCFWRLDTKSVKPSGCHTCKTSTLHLPCWRHICLHALRTNDLQYDARSAFTLSINHRDIFHGHHDRDHRVPHHAPLRRIDATGFDRVERAKRRPSLHLGRNSERPATFP